MRPQLLAIAVALFLAATLITLAAIYGGDTSACDALGFNSRGELNPSMSCLSIGDTQ